MSAVVSMLLFVMLFATFATLAGLRRYMTPTSYYASGPATVTTKAFWRPRSWKRLATARAWWRSVLIKKGSAMFSRKSTSGGNGIRLKRPSHGTLAKCA